MSTIENNLLKGERITYRTGVHWIVFLTPAVLTTIAFSCLLYSYVLRDIALLFLVAGIFLGGSSFITYAFSDFVVTNKRVVAKRGLFTRNVVGLMISKVESIHVSQSITGKLFNYGHVNFIGTGGTNDRIATVRDPFAYRQAVLEVVHGEGTANNPNS